MKWCRYILFSLVLCCLSACTPHMVREARDVVYEADSLRAVGQMYSDSTQIARACRTLEKAEWFYADDYVHSCYHYGRLLREQGDPVSAMQVFINASHSRSHDYHILGRVYCNMGDICHLAGEYSLSYNMYECSANHFLRANDSLAYYYALNDMAFELAEQGEDDKANTILKKLFSCPYPSVYDYACNTKIILLRNLHQYDSIIYYVDSIFAYKAHSSFVSISKAQAFLHLEEYDSAAYYAQYTLDNSEKLFEKDNAYYILIRCDSVKSAYNVYTLNSNRADVEKEIEIRHGKLKQAVQLLAQDLNRKPNLTWLYAIIITICIIGIVILLYRKKQIRKHALWSQKVEDLTQSYTDMQSAKKEQLEQNCRIFSSSKNISKDMHWKDYGEMCKIIDDHFFLLATKLNQLQILNEQEVRLCIMVLLNFSRIRIAEELPYSLNGVGKLKYRVAQKLGTDSKNLRSFVISMAID